MRAQPPEPADDILQVVVGDTINCSADGRPAPDFHWEAVGSGADVVYGPSLVITDSMVGKQQAYACVATNHVRARRMVATKNVTFIAGERFTSMHAMSQSIKQASLLFDTVACSNKSETG